MDWRKRRWMQIGMGIGLFLAGSVAGSALTQKESAVNRFGQPKTVIHVVAYKFRDAASQNDQEQAINGIRDMAGKNPRRTKMRFNTRPQLNTGWQCAPPLALCCPR